MHRASAPKLFAALQVQEAHAKGWVGFLMRNTVELNSSPKQSISLCPN